MSNPIVEGQAPAAVTPATAAEPAAPAAAETDPWAEVPAWAKAEVESVRRESANYRTQLREEQAKWKDAKTPDEVAALLQESTQRTADLDAAVARERAARQFNIPDEYMEFLTAKDADGLAEQAKKLAAVAAAATPPEPVVKQVVVTQPAPSGGQTPGSEPAEEDGASLWRKARRNL